MSHKERIPTSQLIFPNAEQVTAAQISNLLQIGSMAMMGLLGGGGGSNPFGSSIPGDSATPELPGEAKPAAENLFVKVCETLEALVSDTQRWSLVKQQALEKEFLDVHALNKEYLEYQTQAAYNITCPHFRFHPGLSKLASGKFAAVLGNVLDPENAIIGIGDSPEAALRAFDEVFYEGEVHPAILQHLEQREQAIEQGENPEEYPNLNEKEKLESERRKNTSRPARPRAKRRRHRKSTGPKSEIGGDESGGNGDTGDDTTAGQS